jgi:hypothetical protein
MMEREKGGNKLSVIRKTTEQRQSEDNRWILDPGYSMLDTESRMLVA